MTMVKVQKGSVITEINDKFVNNYLNLGWQLLVDPEPQDNLKESPYSRYTYIQLKDIATAKGLLIEEGTNKEEIINELIKLDSVVNFGKYIPSNKGFTDGLIKEK